MLDEKDIDKIFRDGIESAEVEPSESFWNKANESIMEREGISYQKRNTVWKNAAVALAFVVLGLVGYSVYITTKVNNLGKQVADIRTSVATLNNNGSALVMNNAGTTTGSQVQNAGLSTGNSNVTTPGTIQSEGNNSGSVTIANNGGIVSNASPAVAFIPVNKNKVHNNANYYAYHAASGQYGRNFITMLGEPVPTISLPMPEKTVIQRPSSELADLLIDNSSNLSKADSIEKPSVGNNAPIAQRRRTSRLFASAFFAPELAEGNFRSLEKEQFAYTAGVSAGFELTRDKKWMLELGIGYQDYKYSLVPIWVNANSTDYGYVYQIMTSSGSVYAGQISNIGNSAVASGSGERSYLSIPLKLKYTLMGSRKFKLYVTAGGVANILTNNSVSVDCRNSWGVEDMTVSNIAGSNAVSCSYLVGAGAEYILGKGFSTYLEPSWMGAVTPVNNQAAVKAYANFANLGFGIRYHFF